MTPSRSSGAPCAVKPGFHNGPSRRSSHRTAHATGALGSWCEHDFEEVLLLSGSLDDLRLNQTFGTGYYACRPPGMIHDPWESVEGCIMLATRYKIDSPR